LPIFHANVFTLHSINILKRDLWQVVGQSETKLFKFMHESQPNPLERDGDAMVRSASKQV